MFEKVKPISLNVDGMEIDPVEEFEGRPKVRFLFEVRRNHLA
ncbi:hypothetical protein [Thermococcus sp. P6]|nr:hypothetical protein [Thermococcus sp. P6]